MRSDCFKIFYKLGTLIDVLSIRAFRYIRHFFDKVSPIIARSIYSEVLNIIQPTVIKKLQVNKNPKNKQFLNDALLTSIAGISAAMKNTG